MKTGMKFLVPLLFVFSHTPSPAGIDLPVMWSQLPNMDTESAYPSAYRCEQGEPAGPIVAIDFMVATDPALYKPVVALRWWGAYLDGFVPDTPRKDVEFLVSWYFDKIGDPWTPGGLLYHDCPVLATEEFYGLAGTQKIYEYNAYLSIPFDQEYWQAEQPYGWWWFWLAIAFNDAYDQGREWGWHASLPTGDVVANSGETLTGPWTYLDDDVALEMMVVPPYGTMPCFEVNLMTVLDDTDQGSDGSRIEMKGAFKLPFGADFDATRDTVRIHIAEEEIEIPPGSFVKDDQNAYFVFSGDIADAGIVTMSFNLEDGLWKITIVEVDTRGLYETNEVAVALSIDGYTGLDSVIWVKKWIKADVQVAKYIQAPPINCGVWEPNVVPRIGERKNHSSH